ncbi:hypothetical protein [Alkalibacillus haloalkaliphilus]|uniref:hypothetical protein n=1 Tax=Alkalibacillus haloalkaliphilus TaxID=94136 RepID=UPI00293621E0|nr:hypothetical protein [Alkalibacillus haloalkaliphilus]MDV2582458.1 hypothetical protein [Alkalibacillus haloalkaliphilus]
MKKDKRVEAIIWSIALPGFAQLLNKSYIKGIFFILLEIIINVQARFNYVIIPSFQGNTDVAIEATNYQWIMFYPCLYMFAMWDAYTDAGGGKKPLSYIPFASAAFLGTIGVIASPTFQIMGVLLGPIWTGILAHIFGFIIGIFIMKLLRRIVDFDEE